MMCTCTPLVRQVIVAVVGVHHVMAELTTATAKAGKAIAEGQLQLQKNLEKVRGGVTHAMLAVVV